LSRKKCGWGIAINRFFEYSVFRIGSSLECILADALLLFYSPEEIAGITAPVDSTGRRCNKHG
jgi:hypothetical protein